MAKDNVEAFCRALWRHEEATVAFLSGLVDPNGRDRWGNTPLLMAAQYGDLPLVSLLLRRGGDVDQQRRHLTPITLAARRKASAIVSYLREKGATVSILTWIYLGDRKQFERELARDPRQSVLRDEQDTPILHHAVQALQPWFVQRLIDHGATVSDADSTGETPLHRCADIRQAPQAPAATMASLLLDRGADPDARNWDNVTPLHQAVRARNLAVVEVLLARGADPNARDKIRGSTPLRRAVSGTGAGGTAGTAALMVPLTRILLKYGADPDACDNRGVPVHASARAPEVCALLDAHRRRRRAAGGAPRTKDKRSRKGRRKA
jgi:ankyrin repeat protein